MSFQFGAFHFGARQFDACQFGAFHFDAVPVRRVSVWRDASLAHFTLARFPFLCLFGSSRPTLARVSLSAYLSFLYALYCLRHIFINRLNASSDSIANLFITFFLCIWSILLLILIHILELSSFVKINEK